MVHIKKMLSPLLFNFALLYAIKNVKVNQEAPKLNRTDQLLAYADDVNLFGDNTNATNRKNEDLLICGYAGLDVNADKTEDMSYQQNEGQNENVNAVHKSLENVPNLKHVFTKN